MKFALIFIKLLERKKNCKQKSCLKFEQSWFFLSQLLKNEKYARGLVC